ncbi:MAG: hypothetical protein HQK59_10150 [Deltaproteobacteria bacterium]|nr:hypothetical protein [Deltaproteobacteria bacterium]
MIKRISAALFALILCVCFASMSMAQEKADKKVEKSDAGAPKAVTYNKDDAKAKKDAAKAKAKAKKDAAKPDKDKKEPVHEYNK